MDEDETAAGAEESDVEEAEPVASSTPAADEPVEVPAPADAVRVTVEIGDNGEGSAFVGLDVDRCSLWNPPPDVSVGIMAAHTIGIAKVLVSNAEPGSTVTIIVLPK